MDFLSTAALTAFLLQAHLLVSLNAQDLVIFKSGNEVLGRILADEGDTLQFLVPSGKIPIQKGALTKIDRSRPFDRYLLYGWKLVNKKDFAQAETVYREGIRQFGDDAAQKESMVSGLLEVGRGFLSQRRYEQGREALAALLQADPENAEGRKLLDETERMCRKIRKEIGGFRRVLEETPDNDFARFHLGMRLESLGETDKAREEYLSIIKRYPQLNPKKFDGRIDYLRAFIRKHMVVSEEEAKPAQSPQAFTESLPGEWKKLREARLLIFHHNYDLAKEVAGKANEVLVKVEKELRVTSDELPYIIYIYRNHQEYAEATGMPGTAGYCEKARVIHLYQTAPRLVRSVLPHELAHATLYRRFSRLPSWLDEGIAVRYEWGANIYYSRIKRFFEKGETFPIGELFKQKASKLFGSKREIFYAQCYTLVDFLHNEVGGWDALFRFTRTVSEGKLESALKQVYGMESPQELEKRWKRYMEL